MKDSSRLVTFVALLALVLAFAFHDGGLPGLDLFGDSLAWVLIAVLAYVLITKGCCGDRRVEVAEDDGDA